LRNIIRNFGLLHKNEFSCTKAIIKLTFCIKTVRNRPNHPEVLTNVAYPLSSHPLLNISVYSLELTQAPLLPRLASKSAKPTAFKWR